MPSGFYIHEINTRLREGTSFESVYHLTGLISTQQICRDYADNFYYEIRDSSDDGLEFARQMSLLFAYKTHIVFTDFLVNFFYSPGVSSRVYVRYDAKHDTLSLELFNGYTKIIESYRNDRVRESALLWQGALRDLISFLTHKTLCFVRSAFPVMLIDFLCSFNKPAGAFEILKKPRLREAYSTLLMLLATAREAETYVPLNARFKETDSRSEDYCCYKVEGFPHDIEIGRLTITAQDLIKRFFPRVVIEAAVNTADSQDDIELQRLLLTSPILETHLRELLGDTEYAFMRELTALGKSAREVVSGGVKETLERHQRTARNTRLI